MNELTPLTSKNGESEWPYKGKTLIAVESTNCGECIFINTNCAKLMLGENKILPYCIYAFDVPAMYTEKPATK